MAMMGSAFAFAPEAEAKKVTVELTAIETEVVIDGKGTKYKAWTFNGQFPGPIVRVTEGDQVHFVLKNHKDNSRPHSMDSMPLKLIFSRTIATSILGRLWNMSGRPNGRGSSPTTAARFP